MERFVIETTDLRAKYGNIILKMDGLFGNFSSKTLLLLKYNNILVFLLPFKTSHRLQVLYYTLFSPFNHSVRKALN